MIPPTLSRRGFLLGAGAGLAPLSLGSLASAEGAAFADGLLDVFLTGTTTPAPAFADAALRTPLPNPVRADADGRLPPIFLDPAVTYRLRARTRLGALISGMDFDPVPGVAAGQASFRQNDSHAVARPTGEKLGDFVNVLDFHDPALGNDITRALETLLYEAFPGRQAIGIQVPAGHFTVTRQLIPARQLHLRGAGMSATILDFQGLPALNPVMRGAISFGLVETCHAYDPRYADKLRGGDARNAINGADFSAVENLTIKLGGPRPDGLHYGLWSAARLFCRDVIIIGGGFKWCAGALQSTRGTIIGNANICQFSNCHAILASEHAFWADGTDANAGTISGGNAFQPAGFGFYDSSFLGNSYEACHASVQRTPSYKAIAPGGSNRSMFSGCYCEEGAAETWDVAAPSMIISPKGALPDTSVAGRNITLAPMHGGGWGTGSPLNFVTDFGSYFEFGSASKPAARAFAGGMLLRGQGDGDIYQFVASGQQLGGGPGGGAGAGIVRRDGTSGADYELIWFGDPRHRPAFPRGLVATLPTCADNRAALQSGLAEGDIYKTADGALRIVV